MVVHVTTMTAIKKIRTSLLAMKFESRKISWFTKYRPIT